MGRPFGMRFPYRAVAQLAPGLWLAAQDDGEYVLWVEGADGPTPTQEPATLPVTALQAGYLLACAESSRPGYPA